MCEGQQVPINCFHWRCQPFCLWVAFCLCISSESLYCVAAADPPVATLGSKADDSTESAPSVESVERGRLAIESMIQAISRIRCGTCQFEFVYEEVRHHPGDSPKFVLRRDYFLAFDEDRGWYRFDQGDPDKSGRPEQIVMTPEHIYGAAADYMTMTPKGPSKLRQFVEYSVKTPPDVWQGSRDPLIMPFLSEVNFDIYITHRDLRSNIFEKVLKVRPILRYAAINDGLWE